MAETNLLDGGQRTQTLERSTASCLHPAITQLLPSSAMASTWHCGDEETPLKVLSFRSFHNIQPRRKKKVSKPRLNGLGSSFRTRDH